MDINYLQKFWKNYYLASLSFDKKTRRDVATLYAFVRIPDNIVDDPDISDDDARHQLLVSKQTFRECYHEKLYDQPIRWEAANLFHKYNIPLSYANAFREAMLMDTTKKRYQTYDELKKYMYGSAEVVGVMMCHLIWYDTEAISYAMQLGEAMQLTNFLRDVLEDYIDYGRIYLPESDLQKHNLSHQDIIKMSQTKSIDANFEKYMQTQITYCDGLYDQALYGLQYLNIKGVKPVYLAAKLYQRILRQIEKVWYNVFAFDAHTTKLQKIRTLLPYLLIWPDALLETIEHIEE